VRRDKKLLRGYVTVSDGSLSCFVEAPFAESLAASKAVLLVHLILCLYR